MSRLNLQALLSLVLALTGAALPLSAQTGDSAARAASFSYTPEAFTADLSRQIAEHFRVNGDLQVELLRAWDAPAPAAEPITALLLETPSTLSSTMLIRARLVSGRRSLGETSVLVRAQLLREIWVTRQPVERGAAFNPNELDTRRVDVLRERDTLATTETTGELNFSRAVPAGRALSWRDVARRSLVRRGEVIEVAAVDGSLSITMKALAMENGASGETVRVRNLDSKKEFSATVVAESRALVRF